MSLRDTILAATVFPPVEAKGIPVLGNVFVAVNSAYSSSLARKALAEMEADDGCNTGRTLATILTDENGVLLFDVRNPEDVLALSKLQNTTISAILTAASKANSITSGNE